MRIKWKSNLTIPMRSKLFCVNLPFVPSFISVAYVSLSLGKVTNLKTLHIRVIKKCYHGRYWNRVHPIPINLKILFFVLEYPISMCPPPLYISFVLAFFIKQFHISFSFGNALFYGPTVKYHIWFIDETMTFWQSISLLEEIINILILNFPEFHLFKKL